MDIRLFNHAWPKNLQYEIPYEFAASSCETLYGLTIASDYQGLDSLATHGAEIKVNPKAVIRGRSLSNLTRFDRLESRK